MGKGQGGYVPGTGLPSAEAGDGLVQLSRWLSLMASGIVLDDGSLAALKLMDAPPAVRVNSSHNLIPAATWLTAVCWERLT